MLYREFEPIRPLAEYVDRVWVVRAAHHEGEGEIERVVPDGRSELIFNRAAPFVEMLADGMMLSQASPLVVGQMTRFLQIRPTGPVDLIGVCFRPSGLFRLLGVPGTELRDQRLELAAVSPRRCGRLMAAAAPHADELIRLQESLLRCMPRARPARDVVSGAVSHIEGRRGNVRIADLAGRLEVSERQLARRFGQEIGIGPKLFARIARFDALVRYCQSTGDRGWARLAQCFGYFDQAHLIREFRHFTGLSPASYYRNPHTLSDFFTAREDVAFLQS